MAVDTQVLDAEQLIVKHLDLWTSAQTAKSTAGRGSNNKIELTGIKKLRELILELAVRGKLVPQDPNDEPASELLKKIESSKSLLIEEGKIKKEKSISPISEDEIPYELPVGWEFVRLSELAFSQAGFAFKSSSFNDFGDGLPLVRIRDVGQQFSGTFFSGDFREEFVVHKGEYLISMDGEFRVAQWTGDKALLNQRVSRLIFCDDAIVKKFIAESLQAELTKLQGVKSYTTVDHLSGAQIANSVIGLPPAKEQLRITSKIEELMALCDQLEQQSYQSIDAHNQLVDTLLQTLVDSANAEELASNWQRLSEHFDTLFTTEYSIDALKQTILQLAVMGKLVKQDPTDEPASELLKRIAKEKEALIKAGKIKKQKPLPAITDDEKPFELPEGWEWCRISNLALSCDYGTSQKSSESEDGIPVISMGQIQAGVVLTENLKRVPHDTPDIDDLFLKNGDLLYNRTNSAELVGKTGMFSGLDDLYTYASYLIRIRLPTDLVSPHYLNAVMNSPKFRELEINPHVKQQCGQANVNGTIMQSMRIPLPPYAEQLNVIAKVEELTALSNQFVSQLNMNKKTLITLTTSLLGQVMS